VPPTATPPKPTSTPATVPPEEREAGERTPGPQPTPIVPRTGDSLPERGASPLGIISILGLLASGGVLIAMELRHRKRLSAGR